MDHCTQLRLYISIFRALTVGDISVVLIRLKRVLGVVSCFSFVKGTQETDCDVQKTEYEISLNGKKIKHMYCINIKLTGAALKHQ